MEETLEEKVKTLILEEIQKLASIAWGSPTDDNICELFNAVEYLKKVLENDNYSSQTPTWNHSPLTIKDPRLRLTDNNATVRVRKSSDTGDSNFIAQEENSKTNNDDNIFNTYL